MQSLHVFILAFPRHRGRAEVLARGFTGRVESVTIVDVDEPAVIDDDWRPVETRLEAAARACLELCTADVMLLVQADAECDDWLSLLAQCRRVHAAVPQLAVWAPAVQPARWSTEIAAIRSLSNSITALAVCDTSVWSISRGTVARLLQLHRDLPGQSIAIEWSAAAYAYATGKLMFHDSAVSVRIAADDFGDRFRPTLPTGPFVRRLTPVEQDSLRKLQALVERRRQHFAQAIVDLRVEAALAAPATAAAVRTTLAEGRSEHHVPAPTRLEILQPPGVRLTAWYLPRFHAPPAGDAYAAESGSAWADVMHAQPWFRGHVQPHLPVDRGRAEHDDSEAMRRQTELALHYGVGNFCFLDEWVGGRPVGRAALETFVSLDDPRMGFCVCFARGDAEPGLGEPEEGAVSVESRDVDAGQRFIVDVLPLLGSDRYLRAGGRAVLVIQRPASLGDALPRLLAAWREAADRSGVGPLLVLGASHTEQGAPGRIDLSDLDGVVEYPPHGHLERRVGLAEAEFLDRRFRGTFHDSEDIAATYTGRGSLEQVVVPGVFPGWDDTAVAGPEAHVYVNGTPKVFQTWLRRAIDRSLADPRCDGLVFINAWNDWARGAHMAPCRWFGHAYLAACRAAILDAGPLPR